MHYAGLAADFQMIVRELAHKASAGRIIPRSVVPELDCVIANLELLSLRLNESKNAKVGVRQRSLADNPFRAGLLSKIGFHSVQVHH